MTLKSAIAAVPLRRKPRTPAVIPDVPQEGWRSLDPTAAPDGVTVTSPPGVSPVADLTAQAKASERAGDHQHASHLRAVVVQVQAAKAAKLAAARAALEEASA